MWKCHLSKLMDEKEITQSKLSEETGLSEGTLGRLKHNSSLRIDIRVLDTLMKYFELENGNELFSYETKEK